MDRILTVDTMCTKQFTASVLYKIILLPYYRNSILCPVGARLSYNFVIMVTTCLVIVSPSINYQWVKDRVSKTKICLSDVRIKTATGLVDSSVMLICFCQGI